MNFNSSVAAEGYGELILLANKIKKQKNERKKKNTWFMELPSPLPPFSSPPPFESLYKLRGFLEN